MFKGISLTVATTSECSSSDISLFRAANIGLRGFVVFNFWGRNDHLDDGFSIKVYNLDITPKIIYGHDDITV